MLKEIEKKYLEIFDSLPKSEGYLQKLDSNKNKRLLINMSAKWISLYYMKHHRSEKLCEGYVIKRDIQGSFHVDLYQGVGEHGAIWESIVQHQEFHDNFWNIFNWALSIIPDEAIKLKAEQKRTKQNRERRQKRFLERMNSFEFANYKHLIELITPSALNQQKNFWEVFKEGFCQSSVFWDEFDDRYRKEFFFYFVMDNLTAKGSAVWIDWKDIESCKYQINQLLTTHSISLLSSDFEVYCDIPECKLALKNALQHLSYKLVEIDTDGDELLFFLIEEDDEKRLNQTLLKLKEENFIPKTIKWHIG